MERDGAIDLYACWEDGTRPKTESLRYASREVRREVHAAMVLTFLSNRGYRPVHDPMDRDDVGKKLDEAWVFRKGKSRVEVGVRREGDVLWVQAAEMEFRGDL